MKKLKHFHLYISEKEERFLEKFERNKEIFLFCQKNIHSCKVGNKYEYFYTDINGKIYHYIREGEKLSVNLEFSEIEEYFVDIQQHRENLINKLINN